MIPLLRPLVPALHEISDLYRRSEESGLYSNFGPCFDGAVAVLNAASGRKVLPVANGTVALEIALQLSLPYGSRVAVCDFTFAATLSAVARSGMVPVIVPPDLDSWVSDLQILEDRASEFDAFVITSPFGYYVDVESVHALAAKIRKPVVFDFAGAWGMPARTPFPIAYSFHATKNLGIGEGGAVSFSTEVEFQAAKSLINFSFDSDRRPSTPLGMNGKLDELHCALIIAHLRDWRRLTARLRSKRQESYDYAVALEEDPFRVDPHLILRGAPYTAVLGGFQEPDEIVARGKAAGITFRRSYAPLLSDAFPMIESLGITDPFFRTCLALPTDLRQDEMKRVVEFLKSQRCST